MTNKPEYICQTCGGSFSLPLGRTCPDHLPVPRYACLVCGSYVRAHPHSVCVDCAVGELLDQ